MKRKILLVTSILIISAMLLSACGGAAPTEVMEEEPVAEVVEEVEEAEEVEEEEEAAAEMPTELKIAIPVLFLEEAWTTSLLQSLESVIEAKPHGLAISYDIVEDVTFADVGNILDQVAATGEYDIIWAHSTFFEAVGALQDEYPDIAWAVAGSGNEALGGNMWFMDMKAYDAAYLLGVLGGLLTESNSIGTVAEFPFPSLVAVNNAYADGAKSVNPDVEVQVSYIESWFDPPKAIESATAQIANGADFMFSQPIGPIESCLDAEVWCVGHYVDQTDLGPSVVLSGNMVRWDPHWITLIDAWWEYTVNGVAYDAPTEVVEFGLIGGGNDIFPINDVDGAIPAEVIDQVMAVRQQILDGELVVEIRTEAP